MIGRNIAMNYIASMEGSQDLSDPKRDGELAFVW